MACHSLFPVYFFALLSLAYSNSHSVHSHPSTKQVHYFRIRQKRCWHMFSLPQLSVLSWRANGTQRYCLLKLESFGENTMFQRILLLNLRICFYKATLFGFSRIYYFYQKNNNLLKCIFNFQATRLIIKNIEIKTFTVPLIGHAQNFSGWGTYFVFFIGG